MKTTNRGHAVVLSAFVIGFFLSCLSNQLQADPAPALSISLVAPQEVSVTVTNGTSGAVYEIYYAEFLETDATWKYLATGSPGQTNFIFDIDETETGFFRLVTSPDADGDGVPNFQDSRPFDPHLGLLSITIESPLNGSVIN